MARESYDVSGKVVFITGAARGIGWESARRLHARGASVALVGLEPDVLDVRARELGDRAVSLHCDVTDWEHLHNAVDSTVDRFGGIDVCIANAGVANVSTVLTVNPEDFERVVEVNLLGVWRTVRATLPHVIARRGYVLPVASLAAALHAPLMSSYAAAKAGVEAFCNALRVEVAHTGTKVGCAYFGFIDTDMVRDAFDHPATSVTRSSGPKFLSEPIPLAAAGAAIERGVMHRARITYAPRWVGAVLKLRGLIQPAVERGMLRQAQTAEAVRRAEREALASADAQHPATHVPARGR